MVTVLCEGCTERDWRVSEDCSGLDHETPMWLFPKGCVLLSPDSKTPSDGSQGI